MPAFTFVSGHCTRGLARAVARGDGSSLASRSRRAVQTLLVPYVIWQTFYLLYNYVDVYPVQAWSPVGVTWYLSALFAWRASVPYLARLRGRVPALFLVGLAVGFTDTPVTENGLPFLDFQRLVAFAPFFYLGVESSSARRDDQNARASVGMDRHDRRARVLRRDDTRGRGVFRRDAAVGVGDETVRNRGRGG